MRTYVEAPRLSVWSAYDEATRLDCKSHTTRMFRAVHATSLPTGERGVRRGRGEAAKREHADHRSPVLEPPPLVTRVDDALAVQCLEKGFGIVPTHDVPQM